jgi:imidazolonepropionase-like amidohydrolase
LAIHLHGVVLPEDEPRDIFVTDDGRISFESVPGARTVLTQGFLIPGLVDCHSHLAIASPAPDGASELEAVKASARAELDAGVLALREPGSPNRSSTGLGPDMGLPRVFTAGRFLAPRGRYFPGLARSVDEGSVAAAAMDEVKHSGGWTKLIGDFPVGDRLVANFEPQTLHVVAENVHAIGGRVAIHALLPEVIDAAIEAGLDSIEHGMRMTPALVDKMAAKGIAWCPTLSITGEPFLEFMKEMGIRSEQVAEFHEALQQLPTLANLALQRGVVVVAGTDAGMVPHGQIALEVELLAIGGMRPHEALGAASWEARRFLGLPSIEHGAPADLVAYEEDPREALGRLRTPVLRVLDGKQL